MIRRPHLLTIAMLGIALLGWVLPAGNAATTACPVHAVTPCCAGQHAPAHPVPMDGTCAIRCAHLHDAVGLVPVPVSDSTNAPSVPLWTASASQPATLVMAAHLVTPTHAPPRRYALLCTYRC